MVCKKYSAEYKVQKVKEYLEEYGKNQISKAAFAAKEGISDSTFNDWVLKYERDKTGFCNITTEISKLDNETSNVPETVEATNYLIRTATTNEMFVADADYLRLYYNGSVLEFNKCLLERVMDIVQRW